MWNSNIVPESLNTSSTTCRPGKLSYVLYVNKHKTVKVQPGGCIHFFLVIFIKNHKPGFTPAFFLDLELLLFTVIFLVFLIRWYLSASILSDPDRALSAPRCFLDEKREGETGNSRPSRQSTVRLHYGGQKNQRPAQPQTSTSGA